MKRILLTLIVLCTILVGNTNAQQLHTLTLPEVGTEEFLHSGWVAKNSGLVHIDGCTLSSDTLKTTGWIEATVPGTVLTTLLNNGEVPDPIFSMNNELIPDIYYEGSDLYTYWFLNQFTVNGALNDSQKIWLNFRGINYRAEIFLNGKRLSNTTHEGMFLRLRYDITPYIKTEGANVLAVIVYPPSYVGKPMGQGGDGQIARNNTMHYTSGWDWIQPVRDRNTGIWDEVTITRSGAVSLDNPYIVTEVEGVREVEGKQKDAVVKSTVELTNNSNAAIEGEVIATTNGKKVSKKVRLEAGEMREITLDDIAIKNPKLWWPNGVGEQPLYDMDFSFTVDGTAENSDQKSVRYGIREIISDKDPKTGGRRFWVNGQKIFVTGGNYINSDWMLRLSKERYDAEVRFHRDMNVRMIRVWGGALTERPEFYDACDKYGIMVFQDFWTTGDCNGAWDDPAKTDSKYRRREYPDNHELYLRSAKDQIKMLRNHPSLALWCGGNEWPSASDIDEALKNDILPKLDPLRTFTSYSTDTLFTRNTQGGIGDGPYTIQEPEWFYTVKNASPFNPEAGSVGSPEVEGMRRIMTEEELQAGVDAMQIRGRMPAAWSYHKDLGYGNHLKRYGKLLTIEDYSKYAQVVNYDQYRYFMEAWASGMWSKYTGILIWKTQNPWSSLRGQMYDCFLDVNAALYGTRAGCKALHPQFNIVTKEVQLPNTSLTNYNNLTVEAQIFNLESTLLWSKSQDGITSAANSVQSLFEVSVPEGLEGVYFLNLILRDSQGNVLDENTYWQTTEPKNFKALKSMKKSKAEVCITKSKDNKRHNYQVNITTAERISFFNRVKVFDKESGEQVLPVFYSENYITVMPNNSKTIEVEFTSDKGVDEIEVVVESWN